jgi:hypothetical protein
MGPELPADVEPMGSTGPSRLQLSSDGMGVHVASIGLGVARAVCCTRRPYNFFPNSEP